MTLGQQVDRAARRWANPSWWNLLIVLPWTLGAILAIYYWTVYRKIAAREQSTPGVITSHEPANHNRYGYTFSVDGKAFSGWESPRRDKLQIGKTVLVYYDPQNPEANAITDFREKSVESLGPIPLALIGIGTVALFIKVRHHNSRGGCCVT